MLDQGKTEQEALQALCLSEKPKTGAENYDWLHQLWRENEWSTFADYLKWYNDLDVTPMISAIDNMNNFYKERKIDFIHQAISLPGIAMRVCFDSVTDPKAEFHLFNNKNKDIYKLFKDNIVGGPSIIFNRHHEAGKTFIRNNPNKPCEQIVGYDANALYLWAIGQPMLSGYPLIRREQNFYVRESFQSLLVDVVTGLTGLHMSAISRYSLHSMEVKRGLENIRWMDTARNKTKYLNSMVITGMPIHPCFQMKLHCIHPSSIRTKHPRLSKKFESMIEKS